jgi:sialate O-acetylesterase
MATSRLPLSLPLLPLLLLPLLAASDPASLSCGPSLCFASGLSTGAVLQQAPARAALYGSAPAGSAPGSQVVVTLTAAATTTTTTTTPQDQYTASFSSPLAADGTWKVLLDPLSAGGNFSATVACASCVNGTQTSTITDLTFGDVYFCSGQSNAWLPIAFTFERNETMQRVAAGLYSNIRHYRGGLGPSIFTPGTGAGNWVGPAGLEPGSDPSDALTNQWRHPVELLSPNDIRPFESWFEEIPSTCFYFAAYLTDMLGGPGGAAPPMGLVTVPVGGTMLEQWSAPEAQAQCSNVTCMCQGQGCNAYQPLNPANCTKNSDLWEGNVQPFVNMTIKLFLFYQGE